MACGEIGPRVEFMGPFLMYPDEGLIAEVLPRATPLETPVVFAGRT